MTRNNVIQLCLELTTIVQQVCGAVCVCVCVLKADSSYSAVAVTSLLPVNAPCVGVTQQPQTSAPSNQTQFLTIHVFFLLISFCLT